MTKSDAAIRAQVRQLIKKSLAEAKPARPADVVRPKRLSRLSELMGRLRRINK
jgi:hypothetical protein